MMKMIGRVTSCCVALFLALTSVSAVQRINSISDLKNIPFGRSVPEHSLVLLHWFANTVEIENNVIWLNFDPNEDYGSHHYGNFERMLDPPSHGQRYYTVGNLNQARSEEFPSYVFNHMMEDRRNRARIIIRVGASKAGRRMQRIEQVYITQHYGTSEHEGTRYDPQHTYEISINLLREIREFSVGDNQRLLTSLRDRYARNTNDFQLNDIRNTWGNLAGLGLLLVVVMKKVHNSKQFSYRLQSSQNHGNANVLGDCWWVLLVIVVILLLILAQTSGRWPRGW